MEEKEPYFQVPKSLFRLRRNGGISLTAFDIYVLMLDRYRLSKKNNWIDEEGKTYINYSYEEFLRDLNIKKKNIISEGLKELETLNLIKKRKRYRNSTIFYLKIDSNQVVTSISEKSIQKGIENKKENECLKAPNKNNINNNNYKSNNNIYINNNNIYNTGSLQNEIYLLLEGRDIKINQITKICVDIQRIKEVIAYANKKNYGNGFILKALKENWELGLESQANNKYPENQGQKDYSMSIDEALKRSRGKK